MKIALKFNGMYVSAEQGGGVDTRDPATPVALIANRTERGPWETFTAQDLGGGQWALRTDHGHYVTAENGGGGKLRTNETTAGVWEIFLGDPERGVFITWDRAHALDALGPDGEVIATAAIPRFDVEILEPDHMDPSGLPLRQLAAVRGAMWTVRGPWRFGPRPGDPSNITALEYIYSYGDPYHPDAAGGAFNLNDEQCAMIDTYKAQGLTHVCFGPVTAQSYRGHYPDYLFDTPDTFERWLDWLQMFWDHGLAPICFLHPDNWSLDQTKALYDPLIRHNPRAQQLMRIIVASGWEPARYEWSSETWARYQEWGHDLLPNALILLHTVPEVDAPGGTDELGDDNGKGNDKVWQRVAPTIHGWLTQSDAFHAPDAIGDPNHPDKTNYDNWADWFDPNCPYGYWQRFHNGYAGWPTNSLWGNEPIYLYSGEFCSYWNYHDNRPYEEGEGWGDRSVMVGADGYLDSGSAEVPQQRSATYAAVSAVVPAAAAETVRVRPLTDREIARRERRMIR